jgi:hypothetical protein
VPEIDAVFCAQAVETSSNIAMQRMEHQIRFCVRDCANPMRRGWIIDFDKACLQILRAFVSGSMTKSILCLGLKNARSGIVSCGQIRSTLALSLTVKR